MSFVQVERDAIILDLLLSTRSPQNALGEVVGERLKVNIKAPPVENKANTELVRFLAELFDVPRSDIAIVRGATSRRKTVRLVNIHALSQEQVISKLNPPALRRTRQLTS
jgi:uncharacterized protein (TIGR00251 family)